MVTATFKNMARAAVLSGTLLAAACGTLPPGESVPVVSQPEYTEVELPQRPVTPSQTSPHPKPPITDAAKGLIGKAISAASRGDYEQAIALLERALRIGPDRPEVYLSLAQTYTAKGDYSMAKATAERGMLYCSEPRQCEALRQYTR